MRFLLAESLTITQILKEKPDENFPECESPTLLLKTLLAVGKPLILRHFSNVTQNHKSLRDS